MKQCPNTGYKGAVSQNVVQGQSPLFQIKNKKKAVQIQSLLGNHSTVQLPCYCWNYMCNVASFFIRIGRLHTLETSVRR